MNEVEVRMSAVSLAVNAGAMPEEVVKLAGEIADFVRGRERKDGGEPALPPGFRGEEEPMHSFKSGLVPDDNGGDYAPTEEAAPARLPEEEAVQPAPEPTGENTRFAPYDGL